MITRTAQFQLFLLVLVMGFLLGPQVIEALQRIPQNDGAAATAPAENLPEGAQTTLPAPEKRPDPFEQLALSAKGAYVWDINAHRKIYAENADARLPLASVTKVMMALAATEALLQDAKITIGVGDLYEEGDTGLYVGEIWTFEKLLAFTLVASSNDGASAIATEASAELGKTSGAAAVPADKGLFIAKMNEKARAIGLAQTAFYNESGLDAGNRSGGYGSARDMAMLFEYVFRKHPEILLPTSSGVMDIQSESGFIHHIANTNQDVPHIPGIIGSKTGYTDLAGGNLVVIVDIGIDHPIVVVVLGSTREGRFTDVKQLITAATEAIVNGSTPKETN
ncbi:MAG: hypothetical protein A3C93_06135 [Candidatus Lloydbacteria bacterium RIFCSPHIGHO2_02_FULL_54_17]|uniref:Peptidase S11 D-alanyl-D-alanine carboxypeptidase A N-terminal domain-containing protein n=1 Tax=Candidatus Lloydbacteria bacterium RIFCSPHIGHO2_02_FULL_54_17 TaxID=1798664 RepID=A0A1G2DIM3_9BACT|nr:MAG: hypothetical protein A2762_02120 [Candidatus Lloydbacteria bacterium RIFCSPHIGHO2_01_FULL_54_11]OGZ12658.1 MAG: hypothetical protein A3C93_06135 [Candidatus Lloydbacteria bacterium RIFCSPHIGHO2_02_FULL_54_17]OGZ13510.1 MAG: hypothetical protein A2948_04800 [Candidatus Lloydbacteria bacterium RIFCSPLOWO2_01_FULL_54_18]OGZ16182.1 MAG: hypothetical protein A3H76_03635 [Candidatus Lloydbacteria bacterium RIFCSPLOWO2_02_FULL_54_12]